VTADDPADEAEAGRAESTDRLWNSLRIDPVEIALPGGVGYTLRAYRAASELAAASDEREEAEDDFVAASAAVARRRRVTEPEEDEAELAEDELPEEEDEAESEEEDELEDEDEDEEEEDEEDEEEEEGADEEVPVFLGRKGRLYLFHNPEKLVEYVRSGAENDLSQLDTYQELTERIAVDDVVANEDDSYELDLVVENLRGGSDAWDPDLILKAGEIARDLGYALRMETVLGSLAPGSPLDELDETLRNAGEGGVGAFFAKRKLRKIPAQQTSLAWRTVIGKISAVADWRD
jgi:hypothetical protein